MSGWSERVVSISAVKRLPSAPHTEEDRIIWCELMARLYKRHWQVSREADRCDAALMYEMQRYRSFGEIGPLPGMARLPHDPYPYAGGVKLGRFDEWCLELEMDKGDIT